MERLHGRQKNRERKEDRWTSRQEESTGKKVELGWKG
jgi:hypothetical protein